MWSFLGGLMATATSESGITRVVLVGLGVAAAIGALSMLPVSATLLGWSGPGAAARSLGVPFEWQFGISSGATLFTQLASFALAVLLIINGRVGERVVAVMVVAWIPASEWAWGILRNDTNGQFALTGVVMALGCLAIVVAAVLAIRLGVRRDRAEQALPAGGGKLEQ